MAEPQARVKRLSPGELYWGLIDTTGLPPVPLGPLRPDAVERRLAHQLDPVLPVPVENVHAVYRHFDANRVLACGIDRKRIAELQREGHDAVVPASLPGAVRDSIGSGIDPGTLNLLSNEFQPIAAARRNKHRRAVIAAAITLAAALVTLGNIRRESAARSAAADLRLRQSSIYRDALGDTATAGPTPPAVRLTTELRRLSATRGEQTVFDRPRAALDLQSVLALWPADAEIRVERLAVQPARIDLAAEAANAGTVNRLIEALGGLRGWELESNRTDRSGAADDETVRVRLGYVKQEEGEAS